MWTDVCSHLIVQNRVRLPPLTAKDAGYFFIWMMFYLGAVSDVQKAVGGFPHILHPVSPSVTVFHHEGTLSEVEKQH